MNRIAFFDVDTQVDFMDPAGALYVRGAETIWPNLKKLTDFAVARRIPVIASADAHPLLDPEFQQFPPHCIRGMPGARRIPETRIDGAVPVAVGASPKQVLPALRGVPRIVLEKQTFDVFSNPAAERIAKAVGARDWIVYGVATDYCVRAAALGLRRHGFEVTVVTDAVKGITPEGEAKALAEMKRAGVRFIETDVLLLALEGAAKDTNEAATKSTKAKRGVATKGTKSTKTKRGSATKGTKSTKTKRGSATKGTKKTAARGPARRR